MNAVLSLTSLDALPKTPASDVKKLGWRGVMDAVHREGKVLVTNHGRPEAVVLSAEDYDDLLQKALETRARKQAALDELSRQFDARMQVLQTPEAREKLRGILRRPIDFGGKLFTGNEF